MTESKSIKATRATVQLSDTLSIDGYMMPDGESRAGIVGTSILLGYQRDWFLVLPSRAPDKLKALEDSGFRYDPRTVFIQRQGRGGANKVQTIGLRELTALITFEALSGNKRAIALQAAFTLGGLDALFRDAFGMPQQSQDDRRRFFGMTYNEFLEALAENRVELEELRLPGDNLYYTESEKD
ncbi:hypothetical protein QUA82_09920 [Microcoleus sp. F8-D3]